MLRKLGLGSTGHGSSGKAWALVFPQERIYYYLIHVFWLQASFLLEFEFSCAALLSQVIVKLTASR